MVKQTTHGITGPGKIYYGDVHIAILRHGGDNPLTLDISTRAGFTKRLDDHRIGVLAQLGFFDRHAVVFS